jgi:NitT/TauT family transport system substrate-binding protein
MNRAIVAALMLCLLCGCGSPRESSAKLPVRLAISATVQPVLPVVIAATLGYFDQEGLAIHMETLQGTTKAVHALVGGSADVAGGSFAQVLSLASGGNEVKAFTTLQVGSQQLLVASPGAWKNIRRVQDLRGVTVGIAAPAGPSHLVLNYMLAHHGLSPTDLSIVSIGIGPRAVAAVELSKVAAAVINENEYFALRKKGLDAPVLIDLRGQENAKRIFGVDEYPTSVLMARRDWLREHPDTARRVAHAVNRAVRWMQVRSPEAVLEKVPARFRGDSDIDLAGLRTVLPMFSGTGRTPPEGAEAVRRVLSASAVRADNFDLSKTYTNEFLAER